MLSLLRGLQLRGSGLKPDFFKIIRKSNPTFGSDFYIVKKLLKFNNNYENQLNEIKNATPLRGRAFYILW